MTNYLVDTDVIIDVGRKIPEAIFSFQKMITFGIINISQMTQMELIIGCRNKVELNKLKIFLDEFEIISIDSSISTLAKDLLQHYRLSHNLLIGDSIIAATAIVRNYQLVSKNQKDYHFIEDLNLSKYPL